MMNNETEKVLMQAKRVYRSLADETSKRIFKMRTLFNITSDWKDIQSIVLSIPEFKNEPLGPFVDLAAKCQKYSSLGCKIIIYGAGEIGRFLYEVYAGTVNWHCFCDSDVKSRKIDSAGFRLFLLNG